MSKSPAFQFYAAEYLADENVQLMTLEEEGCYIRLMSYCWREGSIPADPEKLSKLCKGASTNLVAEVLKRFEPSPKELHRLVHKRLELEREKQDEWRRKSSEGGRKSAASKKDRENNEVNVNKNVSVVQPPLEGSYNTSFASSSSSAQISDANASSPRRDAGGVAPDEAIYREYPRKEGHRKGIQAIGRAVARLRRGEGTTPPMEAREARVFLFRAVQEYARSPAGSKAEKTKIPHPATWFNGARYLDDRSNWQQTGAELFSNGNGHKTEPGIRPASLPDQLAEMVERRYGESAGWDPPQMTALAAEDGVLGAADVSAVLQVLEGWRDLRVKMQAKGRKR